MASEGEKNMNKENRESGVSSYRRMMKYYKNLGSENELRMLEAELRRAYSAKALRAQLASREAGRLEEEAKNRIAGEVARLQDIASSEDDRRRRSEEVKRSSEYRKILEEQMTRRLDERRLRFEEDRKHRQVLEEIDRITDELEKRTKLEKKIDLAERMRREWKIVREMKEIRKEEEEEREERERMRDAEYERDLEERAKEVRKMREEQRKRYDEFVREIANAIMDSKRKKLEREELITELVAEQIKLDFLIREREEAIKRWRMARELSKGLEEQMVFTEACKRKFAEEDKLFAEVITRLVMEDERLVRLTAEARRRAQRQYREDLDRIIEERRRVRQEEINRVEETVRKQRQLERERIEHIKEERKKLLAEHAPYVAEFINKDILAADETEIVEKATKTRDDRDGCN